MNNEKIESFSERDNQNILNIKEILSDAISKSDNIDSFQNNIVSFSKRLKEKYPDYMDYEFYHILIGSTPSEKEKNGRDFPGDDSVEKFIKSL